mmetsp:Transcript_141901/g.257862  ORF Transcript_141901/g.257862 Transcript_141901/m.257862 type:complete len:348 (+) Transcript_141901:85-1128(+)
MQRITLTLVLLACGGHCQRLHAESPLRRLEVFSASPNFQLALGSREPSRETGEPNSLTALAMFFFALHPTSAFNPSGPRMHCGANTPSFASLRSLNTAPSLAKTFCWRLLEPGGPEGFAERRTPLVRCAPAAMSDATEEITEDALELKEELLDLMEEVTDRGIDAPLDLAEDILDIVIDMDEEDLTAEWRDSPYLEGRWRLIYTSSKTFHKNRCITGVASETGMSSPELIMEIQPRLNRILYEEAIVRQKMDLTDGGFVKQMFSFLSKAVVNADEITVDCSFRLCKDNSMTIKPLTMIAGEESFQPADKQDRASRAMGNVRPVFLDQDIVVFRSYLDYMVWIFERTQ